MCGIFLYLNEAEQFDIMNVLQQFMKIQHRGPDHSQIFIEKNMVMGFHRLAINDLSYDGNQPMYMHDTVLICNGEIYNFKELNESFGLKCSSHSDCETIIKLYYHLNEKYDNDIETVMFDLCNNLDGEFAFIIYDSKNNKIIAARDNLGTRPLFIGFDQNTKKIAFASELKAIDTLFPENSSQFKPSTFMIIDTKTFEFSVKKYNVISEAYLENMMETNLEIILPTIRNLLIKAVEKRVTTTDRPLCCLLSGGLDSSLICGIISKYFLKEGHKLNTFSIGMKGSTDLKYAKKVADFIKSEHHEVLVTKEQMLDSIEEVIRITETWDVTTIRASVVNYLVAKYIKDNSNCIVTMSGELSDEGGGGGGYIYLKKAPDANAFHNECNRLLEEVYYFDNLRADRCISSNGLEVRFPFSDKHLIKYFQSIDPKLRMCNDKVEKFLLRKAFENENVLPLEIINRPKAAFSDACSSEEESWYKIIQNHVDTLISDESLLEASKHFKHNTPKTKEALYYRQIFRKFYQNDAIIPHLWLPKWCGDTNEPSARAIDIYIPEN
jgi:asparagine synthase (glutamine-hydrolysing)